MCQFGDSSKIITELQVPKDEAIIGWRNNYITNSFNESDKYLKSIDNSYLYPKNIDAEGLGLKRENSLGIYNYNNYNYNYNNYNNYNYNYYNYNYNYYNYNIQIKTLHYGKIFSYKEGYRSEYCKVTHLIILDKDSNWFKYDKTVSFANHFNNLLEQLAKEYNCETLEWGKR